MFARLACLLCLFCPLLAGAQTVWPGAESAAQHDGLDSVSGATLVSAVTRPIEIGIITLPSRLQTKRALNETMLRLRRAFAPHAVHAEVLNTTTLEKRIAEGTIDAFVASAGYFMRMMPHGAIHVGTLISDASPDPNNAVAGLFLVRKNDHRITSIEDLEGKSLAASFGTAFMGFRTGMAEVAALGYDPEHFFSRIEFTGRTSSAEILQKLASRTTDAALIASCWFDDLPEAERARYRPLDTRTDNLDCLHSTRTYPGITFAVTQSAPPGVAHVISKTLMSMDKLSGGYRWGIATDLRAVDRLYRELRIEHYAYLSEWSLKRWLRTYWYWLVFVALIVLGLAAHSWRACVLVRRRTQELMRTMQEKRIAQMKADAFREREQKLQKTMLIGQLSSMIAHELSQPLAAIRYYCEGEKALLSASERPNVDLLKKAESGIENALATVTAIVEKVRSYNKGQAKRDSAVDLQSCLQSAVQGVNAKLLASTHVTVSGVEHLAVQADPLEAEILFHNLIKNAIEAAQEGPAPAQVRLTAVQTNDRVCVTIENSGLVLDEAAYLRLTTPLVTTKTTGTGLGIPIALALTEASGGHITFERREEGGIRAVVTLNQAETIE